MNENIHETLKDLLVDIDTLMPLPGNPRVGNIEAIMASYAEFGQVKPIVVRPNGDGTSTVIAGNHQLQAAKRLGWQKIAVVQMEADDKRALAFAMADNRTNELGYTEPELLNDIIVQINDDYSVLLEDLGWDDFELASLNESAIKNDRSTLSSGYVPPVISAITDVAQAIADAGINFQTTNDGETQIVAAPSANQTDLATTGSTAVGNAGSSRVAIQYTLVFDEAEQQRKWYAFLRWLKSEPSLDGDTTAERILNFIEAHADF